MPKLNELAHTSHPIALAVAPLRLDAMQDSRLHAKAVIRAALANLEAHDL